jgi:hypothetical protein
VSVTDVFLQRKNLSPQDLLACIQAQMIYMIMRFVDRSVEPVELNQQLVRTYQVGISCLSLSDMPSNVPDDMQTIQEHPQFSILRA